MSEAAPDPPPVPPWPMPRDRPRPRPQIGGNRRMATCETRHKSGAMNRSPNNRGQGELPAPRPRPSLPLNPSLRGKRCNQISGRAAEACRTYPNRQLGDNLSLQNHRFAGIGPNSRQLARIPSIFRAGCRVRRCDMTAPAATIEAPRADPESHASIRAILAGLDNVCPVGRLAAVMDAAALPLFHHTPWAVFGRIARPRPPGTCCKRWPSCG